jgi:hypothetical protein
VAGFLFRLETPEGAPAEPSSLRSAVPLARGRRRRSRRRSRPRTRSHRQREPDDERRKAATVLAFPNRFPKARVLQDLQDLGDDKPAVSSGFANGAYRDRTGDLRLAKPALSQLS